MRVASVTDFIKVEDINLIFDHLEGRYGYSKQWRIDCREYIAAQAVKTPLPIHDPVIAFLFFGAEQINPLLNAVCCNPFGYGYFMRMVCWLLRDRLQDVGWIKFEEGEQY